MHFNLRMINLVQQIRAVAMAAKVKPEKFIEAFLDEKAQDKYTMDTYAQQMLQNQKKGITPPVKDNAEKIQNQEESVRPVQAPQEGVGTQPDGEATSSN